MTYPLGSSVIFAGTLSRQGESPEVCEDRLCYSDNETGSRAAVADGASQTIFSGDWAELLVQQFCQMEANGDWWNWESLQQLWLTKVSRRTLLWHQQAKLQAGAAAAFLGWQMTKEGLWHAVSVGDCALFQVRNEQCCLCFPQERVEDRAGLPSLVTTTGGIPEGAALVCQGTAEIGDSFYLMTDALANWFLKEIGKNLFPWKWLSSLTDEEFPRRIALLRESGRLHNDDVGLVCIKVVYRKSY